MRTVVACICLLIVGSSEVFAQTPEPDIAVMPGSFDFGTVTIGNVKDRAFAVSNEGPADLIVFATELRGADADQFRITDGIGGFIVRPGRTVLVSVRFEPTLVGSYSAILRIESNDPDESLLDRGLSGIGAQTPEPDIAVTPDSSDFGTVTIGNTKDRAFAVSNEGPADLIVFATELRGADADQFRITDGIGGFIVRPGRTVLVSVRFEPTLVGSHSATLRIESNDPDESLLDRRLSGIGLGLPALSLDRTSLFFGNVPVGSTDSLNIVVTNVGLVDVTNMGLADLEITGTELMGPDANQFNLVQGNAPFTVAPQELDTITVTLSPSSDGAKSALLRLSSNDPDNGLVDIALSGNGVSADITADPTSHDFGEVAVESSAAFFFFIANIGAADLRVDSLEFLGTGADQFRVIQGSPPFTLRPGRTQRMTVEFAPTTGGPQSAVLRLFSNDLDEPEFDLILQGTALTPSIAVSTPSLDFGEVLVALDSSQTFILTNTGQANLTVFQVSVSGGDSTQFDVGSPRVPFGLAPSDSLTMTVRFNPDSTGSKTSTLRLFSNDLDQPQLDLALSGTAGTIEIGTAEAAEAGQDVLITVTLPRNFQPVVQELLYRGAGESTYRVIALTGAGPRFQGIIPGLAVTLNGVEYYVQISDTRATVTLPATNPANQPLFLPVRIDQVEAPVFPQAWTYQMIAVPLELADPDVATVLLDDYGPYNTRRWRLFRWENDDYVEYPAIQDSFATGVGFWLITNDGAPFDVENGLSTDPSNPFTFMLQPGWNQIGNPYAFPIAWPGATIDPRIEAPASFDGTEFQYGETVLNPWEGYFVRNLAPSPLTVQLFSRAPSPSPTKTAGIPHALEGTAQYLLRLSAEIEGTRLRDTKNDLGLVEQASDGYDPFDFTEAPPIGEYVRLSIVEHGERYAGNFKPAAEGGQHWDLEVDATFSQQSVRVRLAGTGRLPAEYGLYLLDRDRREAIAIVDSSFSLDLREEFPIRRLRLLLGTKPYAEAYGDGIPLVPVVSKLEQNYPNPFNPETTIRYQISRRSSVLLEIYNLVGQRVATLVHATQDAGSYVVRWDGRNDEGVAVASGLYLYRLRADAFIATRKMLLIR